MLTEKSELAKATEALRTWITIDTKAVRHNFRLFRRYLPAGAKLMPVVKSNAYGHGLVQFSQLMESLGADYLGVDSITEARRLRREGIKIPILVLGYTRPACYAEALEIGVDLTVSSFESLLTLNRFLAGQPNGHRLPIHLKIDTGMHRQGFVAGEWGRLLRLLPKRHPALFVAGVYSHLAASNSGEHLAATRRQLTSFHSFLDRLAAVDIKPALIHCLSTGGALGYRDQRFNLFRVGLGLYGAWVSPEWQKKFGQSFPLRPVLSWQTIVSEIKTVPAGEAVGYGFLETLNRPTTLVICPIGYWHGFPLPLSLRGEVVVAGRRARVVGRVSMDMIAVDATDLPRRPRVGSTVTLIGPELRAEEFARWSGTHPHEVLTRINPLIKKFYL